MTIPRQGRWLQSARAVRSASSFTTAAIVGAGLLLLPLAEAAAPHSHARRPLPTALHSSMVADTAPHASHKANKGKTGTRSTGASSAGKRAKGKQKQEHYESPIPMYHARRGAEPLDHPTKAAGRALGHLAKGSRHHGLVYGPAPLVSRHGHGAEHPVQIASRTVLRKPNLISHPVHPVAAVGHWAPADRSAHPEVAARNEKPAVIATADRPEIYAEGVSRPDDDERLPRDKAVLGEDAPPPTPAPIARVSAAPATSLASPLTQPQVVQGFGSEMAVPPSSAAERPGGTHRRNHPSNWQPQSLVTQPEPLEEREAITSAAVSPAILPEIYDRNGRLLMPAPLKGSHDVLVHQNRMAASDGLERIVDDTDLDRMRAAHQLVSFPLSESLRVNEDLPYNRRVARPWTVQFAADMGRAFYARFRQPLQINSAVRTVHYQARLLMVNGNAAGISGDAASPHLTGQAIDLAKRGMSQAELAWMRGYLLPMIQSGKIDVEEEFQQACFHVSVYRSYAAGRRPVREVAQVHTAPAPPPQDDAPDQ